MTDLAELAEELDWMLEEPISPQRSKVKVLGDKPAASANPHTQPTRPVTQHPVPAKPAPAAKPAAHPTQPVQSFPAGHPAQAGAKAPPKPQHPTQQAAFPSGHPARNLPTTPHPMATPTATPTSSGSKTSVDAAPAGASSGTATAHSKPTSVNPSLSGFVGAPKRPAAPAPASGVKPPSATTPVPTPAMRAAAAAPSAPVAPKVPGNPDAQRCPAGSHKGPTGQCVPRDQLKQQMQQHQSQAAIHRDNYQSHSQKADAARAQGNHQLAAHHSAEANKSIQAAQHHHGQFTAHQSALYPTPAHHAPASRSVTHMPMVRKVSQGSFGRAAWGSGEPGAGQNPTPPAGQNAHPASPTGPSSTPAQPHPAAPTPTGQQAPAAGGSSPSIWGRLGNAAMTGAGKAALDKGKKKDSFLWTALGHALGTMVHEPTGSTAGAAPAAPTATSAPRAAAPAAAAPAAPRPTPRVSSTAKTTQMPAFDPFANPPAPRRSPTMVAAR